MSNDAHTVSLFQGKQQKWDLIPDTSCMGTHFLFGPLCGSKNHEQEEGEQPWCFAGVSLTFEGNFITLNNVGQSSSFFLPSSIFLSLHSFFCSLSFVYMPFNLPYALLILSIYDLWSSDSPLFLSSLSLLRCYRILKKCYFLLKQEVHMSGIQLDDKVKRCKSMMKSTCKHICEGNFMDCK